MNIKNYFSLMTLGCFLISFVFGEALQAALPTGIEISRPMSIPEGFLISPSRGRITDRSLTGSKQLVINIQDLHCHPEVQRNIAGILSDLDRRFNLKNVYVEGGYGTVDTSWLCNIKDKTLKKEIIETLIAQGRLTGSEYFSVVSHRPYLLKGIENEELHKANIVRLEKILEKQPCFEQKLKLLAEDLEFMKAKYFNSRNRSFDRLVTKYRNGDITADKFYRLFEKHARTLNGNPDQFNNMFAIDRENYRNLYIYLGMTDGANQVNPRRLSRQLQEFLRRMRSTLPYAVYQTVLEKTENLSKLDELSAFGGTLAKEYNIDLHDLPEVQKYFSYIDRSRHINPVQLLQEEKRMTEEIRTGFSATASEAEISFLSDFYPCFRDFLLNRLSAEDYEYFSQRFEKFKLTWARYSLNGGIEIPEDEYRLLADFYRVNSERNSCFLSNIEALKNVKASAAGGQNASSADPVPEALRNSEVIVVVTGGFHTEGLRSILKQYDISYLSITPAVTGDTAKAGEVYAALAKQQAELLSNALQLGLASQALSQEKFQLYVSGANKELQGIKFTRENFDALLEKLKAAIGEENVDLDAAHTRFDEMKGVAVIAFRNGRTITLRRTADTLTFKASDRFYPLLVNAAEGAVAQLVEVINGEIAAVKDAIGLLGLIPGTSSAYLNLMKFAVDNKLVFVMKDSKGYVLELKEDAELRALVNKKINGLAARLPRSAQSVAIDRTRRTSRLREAAKDNWWYEAALAVDLIEDLLISLNTSVPAVPAAANPVEREKQIEELLKRATGSQGDIEIEKLPLKDGFAVWIVRATRGIFRFEVKQEKNGQEEVDTFKDDAGSIWVLDEDGSILKTRDAHQLPEAMPQLVRDRFFNAWAYTEVPTSGPSMIDQMLRANNYSEGIVAELTGLKDEMKNGAVIRAPKGTGPEAEYWKKKPYIGQKWTSADVSALELFMYSNYLTLEIAGYEQKTGKNDPYTPIKDKALTDALGTFADLVEEIDSMTSDRDRLFELLAKAVWGNKFDPSNPQGKGMRFIRDERDLAVRKLTDQRKQMIDYNADNAGPEILNDLLLIRQILKIDKYKKVRLQLKYTPLLVSDATRQDFDKTLKALSDHPSPFLKSLAADLQNAVDYDRLIIVADDAATVTGINFADRTGQSRSMKENADIVIMKGDANYRWITENRHWGIDADLRRVLPHHFPDTLILRAIKHEVMIGADKDIVEEISRGKETLWYRNGTTGMVQYIAKPSKVFYNDESSGNKLIINHIVRSEDLAGIRLDGHRRHSHVVYTDLPAGMTKIEKGRLSPAGFNTVFQNKIIPVWEQEKDGVTYYYLDLAGVQEKDYEQVLGRGAIEIEKQYAPPRSRVTINYFDRSGKMRYDEIGDPVLPADIEADLSHFRTIRKGEAWAVGQNILTFLDDVQDMGGLKKDLKAAVKVGNGLTVLKPEVLETIGGVYDPQNKRYKKYHSKDDYIEKKTAQIAKLARTTGNELFISFLEYSPDDLPAKKEYYRKTGITGYVYRENGVLMVYRYAAGESQAVREVRFTTAEQLSSGIENSSEPYKMVYASDLRRLLQSGSVRAIDERIGAFSLLLRPLLLSISSGAGTNMITRGFVENVAFGWDPESLPGITPGHEQNVVNALEDKERPIDDILAAMGLGEGISHPVKTYVLERLANAGKDEQDRRDLQIAFLKAIFREMLVREKMNGAVLADGELRGILGAKLYEKILRNIPGAAVRISPEAFIAKNDVTAVEFFVRLQAKIRALNADTSPEAINTIIVLAPLGERKTKFRIKHQETFNASSIDAILEAA